MDRQVNLYEAKTRLSRLVDDAARGDTIIIAKGGKPMARLGPVRADRREPRTLGQMSGPAAGTDWTTWWREWKAADKAIEAEFETAARHPLPAAKRAKTRRAR